jgi:phosphoglucomutase
MRFPHLAHRSAAAHKLHSTPQQDRMNLISGNDQTSSRLPAFSLFFPGSCPNNRDRRNAMARLLGLKDGYQVAFANDADADRRGIVTQLRD